MRRMAAGKRKRRIIRYLPEEIVEKVLYNLPVNSLLKFKCVSKSWLSFISSEAFMKEYLKRSVAKYDTSGLKDSTHHKLLFTTKITDQNQQSKFKYSLGSFSLRNEPKITPTLYDSPITPYEGCMNIIGSCNGITLICYNLQTGPLVLWSPSTRKHRVIRSPSFDQMQFYNFMYGLGYDESNDDYKVVCIGDAANFRGPSYYYYYYDTPYLYQTQIYSSKTDSWKEIESFETRSQCFLQSSCCGKFLNGRLHWLARVDEIMSLDLVEEKYQTLSSDCIIGDFRNVWLVELGGYLGLTSLNLDWDVNVWVMKEYGVTESWTKVWTLSDFVGDPSKCLGDGSTMPLCWSKNGDIIVVHGDEVFVCNGKNILRKSRVCMLPDTMNSIVYVESFVSPLVDEQ